MTKLFIDSLSSLLPVTKNGQLESETRSHADEIMNHLKNTHQNLLKHSDSVKLGLSIYNSKYQLFSEYLLNILFSMLANASLPFQNERMKTDISKALHKNRVMLEKSKPIETRMRYQMEKLLELTSSNSNPSPTEELLLTHKPNIMSILEDRDSDCSSSSETEDGVYKAPKIAPAFFHTNSAEIDQKRKETQKRSTKSRQLVNEFKEEFSNRPEETSVNVYRHSESSQNVNGISGITRYEEENFIRVEKKKKSSTPSAPKLMDALDELDNFDLLDKYRGDSEEEANVAISSSFTTGKRRSRKSSKKALDEEITSDEDTPSSFKMKRR